MGHRGFVVEVENEKEIDAIKTWLKGECLVDTDYSPYDRGMVLLDGRQLLLLGCDGDWGIRALDDAGFTAFSRVYSLDDPVFYGGLYERMHTNGKHYKNIKWRPNT